MQGHIVIILSVSIYTYMHLTGIGDKLYTNNINNLTASCRFLLQHISKYILLNRLREIISLNIIDIHIS